MKKTKKNTLLRKKAKLFINAQKNIINITDEIKTPTNVQRG